MSILKLQGQLIHCRSTTLEEGLFLSQESNIGSDHQRPPPRQVISIVVTLLLSCYIVNLISSRARSLVIMTFLPIDIL